MSQKNASTVNLTGLASAPGVGSAGDVYYDTALSRLRTSNGSAWASLAPDVGSTGIVTVGTITTGTWNAGAVTSSGTISATGLAGSLLSSANPLALGSVAPGTSAIPSRQDHVHPTTGLMANPLTTNGDVIYGVGTTPTRLAIGTADQALVTNSGATAPAWATLTLENLPGAFVKKSVRAATTANIATLAGGAPNTLDGVSLALNDRILVKDQSSAQQNGIYTVTTLGTGANGTWARSADGDTIGEIASAMVAVDEGTLSGGLTFDNDLKATDTLGTTVMPWSRVVDTGYSMLIGTTSVQIGRASGTLTLAGITLTQPTIGDFTNATHTHAAAASGGTLTSYALLSGPTFSGTVTLPSGTTKVGNTTLTQGGTVTVTFPTLAGTLIGTGDSGTIVTAMYANSSSTSTGVTYAKMQYASAQYRVLGRITAAAGVIEELTPDNLVTTLLQATAKSGTTNLLFSGTPTITTPVIDSISASSTSATNAIWATNATGSITIGAGLTTDSIGIAASGTGVTPITIGHTNATLAVVSSGFNLTTGGALTLTSTIAASGLAGSLLSSATPVANGTAAAGTATIPSRQDHVHPSAVAVDWPTTFMFMGV